MRVLPSTLEVRRRTAIERHPAGASVARCDSADALWRNALKCVSLTFIRVRGIAWGELERSPPQSVAELDQLATQSKTGRFLRQQKGVSVDLKIWKQAKSPAQILRGI
ncbi:hypothetical protein JG687_00004314 [Phytophthora cactorum]|uniref:Uncharacterized protein n=1 Tax=Phytophthora cactorum TaxID=29920 RepID=A0A329SX93_9STRA|nr:hypothetical protein Pcac1_g17251 [Phytophthora cactorum]KAG2832169.1 hypothetical protein PC112_g7010 [Phytophthora cactorum]KAG2833658.1 hypothetical protein PC111_g6125 [Phytophthora cactorum]KAG2861501.1 hypothetical protein PC113_g7135 [Phytophthora cactorum]KAG2918897.1 hypothetical protein PC114_g6650 [Phytophthora cactorum]